MPKGQPPAEEYPPNGRTSFLSPPAMWNGAQKMRRRFDMGRSQFIRACVAAGLDNPGYIATWLDHAAPDKLHMVMTGEGGVEWEPVQDNNA